MFNERLKQLFLNDSNVIESTKKNYRYILSVASERMEEPLSKNIYEFTPYECDQLINCYSRRSVGVISVIISCLKNYIDFCIKNHVVEDYFNYFATINGTEGFSKYLDKHAMENKYITYEQLIEIQELCQNPQDAICVTLPFWGIKGQEADEILNLKVDQIKEDRIVLKDREIPIDHRTYELIQDAIKQDEYLRGNGDPSEKALSTKMFMNPSEFVVKTAGKNKFGKLNYTSLLMRIGRVKKYFDNPYINLGNLWTSGMLHQIKLIKAEKGEVTREDYQRVNELFGYDARYWIQTKTRLQPYI